MRWSLAAVVLGVVAAPAAAAETTFPYKAVIITDNVYVRSGPGENYYPTDRLKAGQQVEVYRNDAGGWCAIRPPAGSFSWVAGRDLEVNKDNLARVIENHAAARVGSRFSDIREVIQVRLNRGEAVEVLGAKPSGPAPSAAAETWYKIAPPSGEFRWVDGKHVAADNSADGLPRPGAGGRAGRLSAEEFQNAMTDIDVEIATMVAEEPTVWDFSELGERANSLFQQAQTATERGQARLVLGKIARFDDIRQRYKKLGTADTEVARVDRRAARLSQIMPSWGDPQGHYDAVGRLAWIPVQTAGAPQYAIVDPKGGVRCYVSPGPGVNLRSFVGREVGINGTRGYMFEQKAGHLMARQVTLVDEAMLR
ncbi:MAG: SH3 domain-containing protein [Thermoguttaceae bacterium]|jgi:hypothetical protein